MNVYLIQKNILLETECTFWFWPSLSQHINQTLANFAIHLKVGNEILYLSIRPNPKKVLLMRKYACILILYTITSCNYSQT